MEEASSTSAQTEKINLTERRLSGLQGTEVSAFIIGPQLGNKLQYAITGVEMQSLLVGGFAVLAAL